MRDEGMQEAVGTAASEAGAVIGTRMPPPGTKCVWLQLQSQ